MSTLTAFAMHTVCSANPLTYRWCVCSISPGPLKTGARQSPMVLRRTGAWSRSTMPFATKTEKSRRLVTATFRRLQKRENDRDKETGMPAIQAQVKALARWGTDPVTIKLSDLRQPAMIVQGIHDETSDTASLLTLF